MMQFAIVDENTVVATNSIKSVRIVREVTDVYDRNVWTVYTEEGRLLDDVTVSGPFNSFHAAKRDAECEVGMSIKYEVV
jgi:hypothetical protein